MVVQREEVARVEVVSVALVVLAVLVASPTQVVGSVEDFLAKEAKEVEAAFATAGVAVEEGGLVARMGALETGRAPVVVPMCLHRRTAVSDVAPLTLLQGQLAEAVVMEGKER